MSSNRPEDRLAARLHERVVRSVSPVEQLRRLHRTRRRGRVLAITAGVALLAIVIGLPILWLGRGGTPIPYGTTAPTATSTAVELFGILGGARSGRDTAPETQRALSPGSERQLYSGDGESYWLAVDLEGYPCLIVAYEVGNVEPVVAMACDPPALVAERGLSLRLAASGAGVDVTVVPDLWRSPALAAAIEETGGTMLTPNLIRFGVDDRPVSVPVELPGSRVDLGSGDRPPG
jgi:hypothetical protein